MANEIEFFPVGSVFELVDDDGLYIVLARAISKDEDGELFDRYKVALYPKGDTSDADIFTVGRKNIKKVVFEGFTSAADDEFIADLLQKVGKAPRPAKTSNAVKTTATVQQRKAKVSKSASDVSRPQEDLQVLLDDDPFYKFRTQAEG